jgi:hypothetical protein
MTYNFWFGVIDEDSDLCGEEFIVEVDAGYENDPLALAWDIAAENFGDVKMKCYGCISTFEAEMMGLDTY